jgi:hypothetical protein
LALLAVAAAAMITGCNSDDPLNINNNQICFINNTGAMINAGVNGPDVISINLEPQYVDISVGAKWCKQSLDNGNYLVNINVGDHYFFNQSKELNAMETWNITVGE